MAERTSAQFTALHVSVNRSESWSGRQLPRRAWSRATTMILEAHRDVSLGCGISRRQSQSWKVQTLTPYGAKSFKPKECSQGHWEAPVVSMGELEEPLSCGVTFLCTRSGKGGADPPRHWRWQRWYVAPFVWRRYVAPFGLQKQPEERVFSISAEIHETIKSQILLGPSSSLYPHLMLQ